MLPEKNQFKKWQNQLEKNKKQPSEVYNSKLLKQAAIKSKWLLNDPKWDTYLTWIQADIEELKKIITASRDVLENPGIVNHDEIMKAKIVLLEAKAMLNAFSIAITYPSQIVEGKKDVEDRIKDLNVEGK